jgi:hypothetical protein
MDRTGAQSGRQSAEFGFARKNSEKRCKIFTRFVYGKPGPGLMHGRASKTPVCDQAGDRGPTDGSRLGKRRRSIQLLPHQSRAAGAIIVAALCASPVVFGAPAQATALTPFRSVRPPMRASWRRSVAARVELRSPARPDIRTETPRPCKSAESARVAPRECLATARHSGE